MDRMSISALLGAGIAVFSAKIHPICKNCETEGRVDV